MVENLIYTNYATCLIVLFMVVFLITNTSFDKKDSTLFMRAILLAVVLVVVDSVESWTATFSKPCILRILMSSIGYTVRPLCIMCILHIVVRNKNIRKYLLIIPAILNAFVSFSALFCELAFSYNSSNEFVRGPLGWTPFYVSGIYLLVLILYSIQYFREKNYYEAIIVFAIVIGAIVAVLLEMIYNRDGLINSTIVISIAFYYLFFHVQTFKRDALTKTLNRRSFYMDASKYWTSITALIGIDLNYLKKINDSQGHEAGDAALQTLADCANAVLTKGFTLYRVGGDEFFIICLKKNESEVINLAQNIKLKMANTPYRCAVGIAMKQPNDDLSTVYKKADSAMYEDKLSMHS